MSNLNDGGPAFPRTVQRWNDSFEQRDGMSLRDYFAAKAITGLLSNSEAVHCGAEPTNSCLFGERSNETAADYARLAYQMADALLAARQSQEGEDA